MVKNLPANEADGTSTPRSGRSPGGGNGNPIHYFCLENPMDRGAWRAIVHGLAVRQDFATEHTHTHTQRIRQ